MNGRTGNLASFSGPSPMRPGGSYRGKTGHASQWWARRFMIRMGVWLLNFVAVQYRQP